MYLINKVHIVLLCFVLSVYNFVTNLYFYGI